MFEAAIRKTGFQNGVRVELEAHLKGSRSPQAASSGCVHEVISPYAFKLIESSLLLSCESPKSLLPSTEILSPLRPKLFTFAQSDKMAEIHAALERAVQDKAKNDAAIDALGEKMKAVEALMEELVLTKRKDTLSEGEREHLEALKP